MVGGNVVGVIRKRTHTKIVVWGVGCDRNKEITKVVTGDHPEIKLKDMVWWQGRDVYWTPKDKSQIDVKLPEYREKV